jgi:hypothetical protein
MTANFSNIEDTVTIIVRCHCGTISHHFSINKALLPLKSSICHCNDCRYASGQLFVNFAVLDPTKSSLPDLSTLTKYSLTANQSRYFCPQCGACACLIDSTDVATEVEWGTGLLDPIPKGLLKRHQVFVGPTLDGGASVWIPKSVGGMPIRRFLGQASGMELDDALLRRMMRVVSPMAEKEMLSAKCHCESVAFYITRPKANETHAEQQEEGAKPRHRASLCLCTSCALTSGFELTAWGEVPVENILSLNGTPFDLKNAASPLREYNSSPGVHRHFCGTCGASVFYRNDSREEKTWDISMGLFRDIVVRAEGWFDWDKKPLFKEDARDREFVDALVECMGSGVCASSA